VRVIIFGAGAIGGLLGALLHRAHNEVVLIARERDVVSIRLNGLVVEGATEGTFHLPAFDALTDGMESDALLLTVKAPALHAAGLEIGKRLRPLPPILALQNGLEVESEIVSGIQEAGARSLPGGVSRGINTIPATRLSPGHIRHAGGGELLLDLPQLPEAQANAARFLELMRSAGISVRQVPDFRREVWRKLLVNASINPVTADHGVLNGQLALDPWRGQAETLLREALSVARAEGVDFPLEEVEADLWRIVRATQQNKSSMLQDVERGGVTEIDAISGALLRLAERHGLKLPATERAYQRIRARAPAH
jgi:2-dehydropantoate 2-reductase